MGRETAIPYRRNDEGLIQGGWMQGRKWVWEMLLSNNLQILATYQM